MGRDKIKIQTNIRKLISYRTRFCIYFATLSHMTLTFLHLQDPRGSCCMGWSEALHWHTLEKEMFGGTGCGSSSDNITFHLQHFQESQSLIGSWTHHWCYLHTRGCGSRACLVWGLWFLQSPSQGLNRSKHTHTKYRGYKIIQSTILDCLMQK